MNAAKRENIPIIVLDRPNPINANIVDGSITNPAYSSFVGVMPLPIRYSMTVGELTDLFNNENFGGFLINAFVANKPPPPHMFFQEVLIAAETGCEYFS